MLMRTCCILLVLLPEAVFGAQEAGDFPWIDPNGISVAVLLCGNTQPSSSVVRYFGELAHGAQSQIIVVAASDEATASLVDVVPGTMIDCGPLDDGRRDRLIAAVTERPDRVVFHIPGGAALALHGRRIDVLGDAAVTVMLAA